MKFLGRLFLGFVGLLLEKSVLLWVFLFVDWNESWFVLLEMIFLE